MEQLGSRASSDTNRKSGAEVQNFPRDELTPVDAIFLPDGRIVASIDRGSVATWDVESGRRELTIGPGRGSAEPVVRVAANPEGTWIATVRDLSSTASVWDAHTRDLLFEIDPVSGEIIADVGWAAGDRLLVLTPFEGSATVFDRTGEEVGVVQERAGFILDAAAISRDGRHLATSARPFESPRGSHLTIWDTDRGRVLERRDIPGGASVLDFDPSGQRLAIARIDGRVEILNVPRGDLVVRFPTRSGPVHDLVYNPDGSRIAIASEDGTVRVFDARDGTQQLILRGHGFLVSAVAFNADGTQLASAGLDGLVRVWALDLDDLIDIAHEELTRELSDGECRQYLHMRDGCE